MNTGLILENFNECTDKYCIKLVIKIIYFNIMFCYFR